MDMATIMDTVIMAETTVAIRVTDMATEMAMETATETATDTDTINHI